MHGAIALFLNDGCFRRYSSPRQLKGAATPAFLDSKKQIHRKHTV